MAKTKKRSTSTALARTAPRPAAIVVRERAVPVVATAPRKRRRSSGSSAVNSATDRLFEALYAAGWGYLEKQAEEAAAKTPAEEHFMMKIPTAGGVGRTAVAAIGLHFAAQHFKNKHLDRAADSVANIALYKFGRRGGKSYEDKDLTTSVGDAGDLGASDFDSVDGDGEGWPQ